MESIGTKVLDRSSKEARELARRPVGKTWINADAVEEARQMGARWVRVIGWGGEGRGVYGVLELPNWLLYADGTNDLVGARLAITVDKVEDLGREPWIEVRGRRHYIGRYQYSGTMYYLQDDDDPGRGDRPMPAGAVPIEDVLSLPNHVFVAGLAHHSKDEVNAQR